MCCRPVPRTILFNTKNSPSTAADVVMESRTTRCRSGTDAYLHAPPKEAQPLRGVRVNLPTKTTRRAAGRWRTTHHVATLHEPSATSTRLVLMTVLLVLAAGCCSSTCSTSTAASTSGCEESLHCPSARPIVAAHDDPLRNALIRQPPVATSTSAATAGCVGEFTKHAVSPFSSV